MVLLRSVDFFKLTSFTRQIAIKTQQYSTYPSFYVKPIYKHPEQEAISQTEEGKHLAHRAIKPALTTETCSEFHDPVVRKFTNYIMRKGNKDLARGLLEKTFENIKIMQLERYNSAEPEKRKDIELDPTVILHRAVANSTPILQLQNTRRGGIVYQVPVPVSDNKAKFIAMNWLIRTAKEKDCNQRFYSSLAKELIDASNNTGRVIKRKQELHKQCEANRAYAHFRWL